VFRGGTLIAILQIGELFVSRFSPCFFGHSFPFVGIHNIAVLAGQSLGRRKICPAILDFRFLLLCLEFGILESRISSSVMWSQ